jgi:CO/xanthine dehydrogenase FAD-binding subunit
MGRTPKELEVLAEDLDRQVQDVISPIDDARGSAWYRRRLIRPLIEKGLARVADRAAG